MRGLCGGFAAFCNCFFFYFSLRRFVSECLLGTFQRNMRGFGDLYV